MNYKNLIVFVGVVSIILIPIFGYLSYVVPIEEQKRIHNLPLVKNCTPAESDDTIQDIQIGNYTHMFDPRSCEWMPMKKSK